MLTDSYQQYLATSALHFKKYKELDHCNIKGFYIKITFQKKTPQVKEDAACPMTIFYSIFMDDFETICKETPPQSSERC